MIKEIVDFMDLESGKFRIIPNADEISQKLVFIIISCVVYFDMNLY